MKAKYIWSDMMETGRYKFTLILLCLLFLVSILVFFNVLQMKKNMTTIVRAEPAAGFKDIGALKDEIESMISANTGDNQTDKYIFDENLKEMIVKRNIFGLIEKAEEEEEIMAEEDGEDYLEEMIVDKSDTIEDDFSIKEEFDVFADQNMGYDPPNPFYLQGVSINQYNRMAIIINKYNSMTYLIKPGITVEGYYVESIDLNEAVLEKDGQKIFVRYY
ncbi:MAG: hypothetical protein GX175_07855 [Halanaerobiaceae bacterium]|jgi:hypothetical protein|nr:hypothetical protein [Halanaerobiaceae bacterium]